MKQINQAITGADLAWQARVEPGLVLRHPVGVVIGPHVHVGRRLTVQQGVTIGGAGDEEGGLTTSPRIGNFVRIGAGAKVFGSIRLGDHVTVGANAVVIADVPDRHTAVGVPARVIASCETL